MITGKDLLAAYNLISRCGKEVSGLSELLGNMLAEEMVKAQATLPCVPVGEPGFERDMDESQTVYMRWLHYTALKSKGRGYKKPEMYLAFQISMMDDGCAVPGYTEPLLHVFCWGSQPSLPADNYVGFPLRDEDSNPLQVIDDRMLQWDTGLLQSWNRRAWTYSLRLVLLNSPEDLQRHVVKPTFDLLRGKEAFEALPDSLSALVKYPETRALLNA